MHFGNSRKSDNGRQGIPDETPELTPAWKDQPNGVDAETLRIASRFWMRRLTSSGQYRVVTILAIPRRTIFGNVRYRRVWELERVQPDPQRKPTQDRRDHDQLDPGWTEPIVLLDARTNRAS